MTENEIIYHSGYRITLRDKKLYYFTGSKWRVIKVSEKRAKKAFDEINKSRMYKFKEDCNKEFFEYRNRKFVGTKSLKKIFEIPENYLWRRLKIIPFLPLICKL